MHQTKKDGQMQERILQRGFTLIELSIVLVIIGLIVGGILVGADVIRSAGVRSTLTQVEKYNTAVNTFKGKYGYLPGDISNPTAPNFGFVTRGQYAGEGDGSGVIEGVDSNTTGNNDGVNILRGETAMFWVDLSTARLIDGTFNTASPTTGPGTDPKGSVVDSYLPQAKIGKGNYFFVWSGGWQGCYGNTPPLNKGDSVNYFGLSEMTGITANYGQPYDTVSLTPQEAYAMDKKVDDGYPQSGRVLALFPSNWPGNNCWAAGNCNAGAYNSANAGPTTAATAPSATTCYDNGSAGGTPQSYSMSSIAKNSPNCALSFMFQ